ncbi:TPA: hypothetical protein ANIA_11526 [Aspergillus nidulans FGSC A4]|uniref:Uncharacterized protein n=1 Tax=Emericella nidulans (strain FGSC A4 / ATCC 38163 / CBS 112.46 / NRRL 194 / M139) TaxID=227321 RepID=C8V1Y9_EMENI|nr:TPA: hypothetical protein ANIA_11526 [Aspergillus nidulans FGSC A4]
MRTRPLLQGRSMIGGK